MPGGSIEFGETPQETLKRELSEIAIFELEKLGFKLIMKNKCNN